MEKNITVIGGSHVTVSGVSFGRLCPEGSSGVVSLKLGGEALTLSERLAVTGTKVKLITAFGQDNFASEIKGVCDELGIDYSQSLNLEAPTSVVVELGDGGDTSYKVLDYRVLRNMDINFLTQKLDTLNSSAACYVDAEFDSDKLQFLFENITSPIFTDTISVRSSNKLRPLLGHIHTIKPNKAELENLVGFSLVSENNFLAATELLLHAGVKNVFVTCGKDGIWYNDGKQFGHVDAGTAVVVNKAGAGVAVGAAIIKGFLAGDDIRTTAENGIKAALEYISGDGVYL